MWPGIRQVFGIAGVLAVGGLVQASPDGLGGPRWQESAAPRPLSKLEMLRDVDPIHVFYPLGPCQGTHLMLELWERQARRWIPHPEHARVPAESCQVEDAGALLNELRWRCDDEGFDNPWNVGLDVFDPAITESCSVGELRSADYRVDIHVSAPSRSTVVRSALKQTTVRGSIRIDGLEGVAYDVLLAIDRSGGRDGRGDDRLRAQIQAAQQFVLRLRPRLGSVRLGLVSYPNPEPGPGESRKGRLELPLTTDPELLTRALARVEARGAAGPAAFADGLEHSLNQILLQTGDRPGARRELVIAADGHAAPFREAERVDPVLFMRLDALADEARRAGVRLHVLALGGYAEGPSPLVRDLVARSYAHFERVPHGALDSAFFARVTLPRPNDLRVINPVTGTRTQVSVGADGQFAVAVPVDAGLNRLRLRASASNGATGERDWLVEYDDTAHLRLVLEAERMRVQAERERQRKQLDLGADPSPEVAAGPPEPSAH